MPNVPKGIKKIYMVPPALAQIAIETRPEPRPAAAPADPLADVRAELGDSIADLLADHGFETMEDIAIAFALEDEDQLKRIRGIGPKTVEALRRLSGAAGDEDE